MLRIEPIKDVEETLNATLGTNIYLSPKVGTSKPACLPKYVTEPCLNAV